MTKAEQRATELGYHNDPWNRAEYTANDVKQACIEGYQQAEKDVTDAFIEKACAWIKENFVNDHGLYCVTTDYNTVNEMTKEFRKYMEGE